MYIQEFGELLPFNLQLTDVSYNNITIYSNDKILNEIKEYANTHYPRISEAISRAIDNKKLIIGYSEGGLHFLWNRFKKLIHIDKKDKYVAGYYNGATGKIAIILDESVSLFGARLKDQIFPTIIHELCHCIFKENRKRFIIINEKDYILPFYLNLIGGFINGNPTYDVTDIQIKYLVRSLYIFESRLHNVKNMRFAVTSWVKFYNGFLNDIVKSKSSTMLTFIPLLFMNDIQYAYSNDRDLLKRCITNYLTTYKTTANIDVLNYTLPGQECILPSEIIAVINSIDLQPEMIRLINQHPMTNMVI